MAAKRVEATLSLKLNLRVENDDVIEKALDNLLDILGKTAENYLSNHVGIKTGSVKFDKNNSHWS